MFQKKKALKKKLIVTRYDVYKDEYKDIPIVIGETYKAFNRVNVFVNGERLAKLAAKERGKATNIGQNFTMTIEVIREKGGETETYENLQFKLPYSWDGIVINIPAYLNDLPQEAWMSEFIAAQTAKEEDTEEIVTDEFALGDF